MEGLFGLLDMITEMSKDNNPKTVGHRTKIIKPVFFLVFLNKMLLFSFIFTINYFFTHPFQTSVNYVNCRKFIKHLKVLG